MNRYLRLFGSKTVIGTAGMALSWLASQPVIDTKHIIAAVGGVVASGGLRDALHQVADAVKKG